MTDDITLILTQADAALVANTCNSMAKFIAGSCDAVNLRRLAILIETARRSALANAQADKDQS